MKQNRIFLNTLLGAMALGVLAIGCKDDFSEEDLLESQVELAEQQEIDKTARLAESLNAAGELLSYSVKVVSSNNQPVAGANVTLKAGGQAEGENDSQTLTTDANGEAFFGRAVIGGNTLSISAEGYFDVIASVDFGTIDEGEHYQIIDGLVVPTPVTESSIIPLFSDASGNEIATISGVVSIETDLTNTVPEVPQDLTLRADLSNFASQFNVEGSVTPQIYTFDDDVTIGSAVVDNATGAYSMTVPATPDGIFVSVLVPNVSAEQTLAITSRNGFDLDRPEYAQVVTNFGSDWSSDYDIPYVPGAIWVFDEPQGAAGAGFDFTYERLGRPMTTGFNHLVANYNLPGLLPGSPGAIVAQVTNTGEGYTESPVLSIEDPTGTGAVAEAHIEFTISEFTVRQAGDNAPNASVDFNFYYDEVTATYDETSGMIVLDTTYNVNDLLFEIDLDVITNADGDITTDSVNKELNAKLAENNPGKGYDLENPYRIAKWVTGLRLMNNGNPDDLTNPIIDITGTSIGRVYQFVVTDGGENYTNPSFTFSGGGDNVTEQAQIDVLQFGTQWLVTPNNSGVTEPYTILPPYIAFEHIPVTAGQKFPTQNPVIFDDKQNFVGLVVNTLEVDGNGNIQFIDQLTTFATGSYSHEKPRTILVEPESLKAKGFMYEIDVDENGGITDYDVSVNEKGKGYASQFTVSVLPAVEGAPGSGAQVDLIGGTLNPSGEYEWDGEYEIKSGGSGYLENLNQQGYKPYSGSFNQTINSGQEYFLNIQYGTGAKQEEVDGVPSKT